MLYHDFGDEEVFRSSQQLVLGGRVQIIPLTGEYAETGSRKVSFKAKAGLLDTSQREDITPIIPTELTDEQWITALEGEVDPANISVDDGNATIDLGASGPSVLGRSAPVTIRHPDSRVRALMGSIRPRQEISGWSMWETDGSVVSLFFKNTGGTNNFTQGRINFYEGPGKNDSEEANISKAGENVSATLVVSEDYETLDPKITVRGRTEPLQRSSSTSTRPRTKTPGSFSRWSLRQGSKRNISFG